MASPCDGAQGLPPMSLDLSGPSSRPALLPAFEPVSSSPSLPRPPKRKLAGSPTFGMADIQHYPTPVPTSSTAFLPSSPPRLPKSRPGLQRSLSTFSERQPLGTVPSIEVPVNGEFMRMGRSSNSSDYQLSANRLISRVHVRAKFCQAREAGETSSVIVECLGWNGCKIHCRGQAYELAKGDTFSSTKPQAEMLLDVQDARVLIRWPAFVRTRSLASLSDAWEDAASPCQMATPPVVDNMPSSPPEPRVHLHSPVSPSPRGRAPLTASSTFLGMPESSPTRPAVQVYEDASSDESASADTSALLCKDKRSVTDEKELPDPKPADGSSPLSDHHEFSDADEENDPIVHSFGIFGESLLPRMASITATSPRQPLRASASPQQRNRSSDKLDLDLGPIRNHVINQLAFSRLHSLPLSTIMSNLPSSMKGPQRSEGSPSHIENMLDSKRRSLTREDLKSLLDETPCVGEIAREGKDAAGKLLEDEFYYVPEMDTDLGRRNAVENSLGKPGIRNVRKQHKQYFWKRPRH